jgi:hypothetical protein
MACTPDLAIEQQKVWRPVNLKGGPGRESFVREPVDTLTALRSETLTQARHIHLADLANEWRLDLAGIVLIPWG